MDGVILIHGKMVLNYRSVNLISSILTKLLLPSLLSPCECDASMTHISNTHYYECNSTMCVTKTIFILTLIDCRS